MGGRIARRLVDGGEDVVGFDLDAARAADAGARAAASLAEVARDADVVLLSLPDSPRDRGGRSTSSRRTCAPGRSSSTSAPRRPPRPSRSTSAWPRAASPTSTPGSPAAPPAAEAGTLTIMAGGEAEALDAVRPVLAHFAAAVHHMGASGSGHVAKLINNFLNAVSLAATAEAMVAGRKAGLDLRQLLEVINASSGVNFATLNRFPRIVEGDYLEGGLTSDLMAKDVMLYLDLVRELGVTSLNGPPCLAAFHLAAALGYGDQISNRVVDALGDIAGGVRIHDQTREAT